MFLDALKAINKFDNYILNFIKKYIHNKYLDILMVIITLVGKFRVVWIIIAVIISLGDNNRLIGYMVILTLITSTILGEVIIKNTVKRVRQCNKDKYANILILKPRSYSFPSRFKIGAFVQKNY